FALPRRAVRPSARLRLRGLGGGDGGVPAGAGDAGNELPVVGVGAGVRGVRPVQPDDHGDGQLAGDGLPVRAGAWGGVAGGPAALGGGRRRGGRRRVGGVALTARPAAAAAADGGPGGGADRSRPLPAAPTRPDLPDARLAGPRRGGRS